MEYFSRLFTLNNLIFCLFKIEATLGKNLEKEKASKTVDKSRENDGKARATMYLGFLGDARGTFCAY